MSVTYLPAAVRRQVYERADGRCEYCRLAETDAFFAHEPDHIISEKHGGDSTINNLALSCQGCNNYKYVKTLARDPVTKRDAPLFHPRRDVWREHFAWSVDSLQLLGLTPTGRATVAALKLNREGVINLRYLLTFIGKHPPD